MIRPVVFLLSVLWFGTVWAQNSCLDLFQKSQEMAPFDQLRSRFEPGDLREAGQLIDGKSHQGVGAVQKLISERDGTYPLIIDIHNNIMIEHRLPTPEVGLNEDFLATHRGLYAKLQTHLKAQPQVIFAGQIRVVGGQPINLIDQAGTFFMRIEDYKEHGDQALTELIASNQRRLDFATQYLLALHIIHPQTQIINFRKLFRNYGSGSYNQGHTTARKAAIFEQRCRTIPSCLQQAQKLDFYLRKVSDLGGEKYLIENMRLFLEKNQGKAGEVITWLSLLLQEGTYDVMANVDIITSPQSERAQGFNNFLNSLEFFFGPYQER